MELADRPIGVIGGGVMGTTILEALIASKAARPDQLMVGDARPAQRKALAERLDIAEVATNAEVAAFADVLVLATKPQVFDRVLAEIRPHSGPDLLVVSIAAGVSTGVIEAQLEPGTRVVRTMPNTPAQVRAGATGIARGRHASQDDLDQVEALFESVGIVEVLDETALDAVTGLSGSGPAFVFVMIEAMADAGVKVGLHRSSAQRLAAQTVLGAAQLLIETGEHPGRLKDRVCSPGGTTIAGLHVLEAGGLRTTMMNAVEAATDRSRELGEEIERKLQP
jgi:pyrroline-5-carboxylate reductase